MTAEIKGSNTYWMEEGETVQLKMNNPGRRAQVERDGGRLVLRIFSQDHEITTLRKCLAVIKGETIYRRGQDNIKDEVVVPPGNYAAYLRKGDVVKIVGTFEGFNIRPRIYKKRFYRDGEMIQTRKGIEIKAVGRNQK